ncbi:MAG: hypothetical protein KIT87_09485 [Anaerolineae bacterium]|nr:hypothetical protein [Anaerolineae bacterium]
MRDSVAGRQSNIGAVLAKPGHEVVQGATSLEGEEQVARFGVPPLAR